MSASLRRDEEEASARSCATARMARVCRPSPRRSAALHLRVRAERLGPGSRAASDPRLYPEARLRIWPGWGHCERMSRDSVALQGLMLRNVALEMASTDRS